jgi:diguanylate cyclase (GGDEF)-like protein
VAFDEASEPVEIFTANAKTTTNGQQLSANRPIIYWTEPSGSTVIGRARAPWEEKRALSGAERPTHHAPSLEEVPGWRQPAFGSRLLSARSPTPRAPHELKQLENYLFLALLLVGAALVLALVEQVRPSPYVTAMRAAMTFALMIVCVTAIFRLRNAREGLVRTSAPSTRDAITSLPDEQYFWLRLREEHARARRYGEPFSVAVLDVNSLASVNRAYGQAAGDAVLGHVARVLESAKRGSDVAVRLTDDEFALLLLGCDHDGASAFVTRVQQYLNGQPATLLLDGRTLTVPIGVSIGVAAATARETSSEELVARARHNLAVAKEEKDLKRERWAI